MCVCVCVWRDVWRRVRMVGFRKGRVDSRVSEPAWKRCGDARRTGWCVVGVRLEDGCEDVALEEG